VEAVDGGLGASTARAWSAKIQAKDSVTESQNPHPSKTEECGTPQISSVPLICSGVGVKRLATGLAARRTGAMN